MAVKVSQKCRATGVQKALVRCASQEFVHVAIPVDDFGLKRQTLPYEARLAALFAVWSDAAQQVRHFRCCLEGIRMSPNIQDSCILLAPKHHRKFTTLQSLLVCASQPCRPHGAAHRWITWRTGGHPIYPPWTAMFWVQLGFPARTREPAQSGEIVHIHSELGLGLLLPFCDSPHMRCARRICGARSLLLTGRWPGRGRIVEICQRAVCNKNI
jgi:hypothetical protein